MPLPPINTDNNSAHIPIEVKVGSEPSRFEAGTYSAEFIDFDGPITSHKPSKFSEDGKPQVYYKFVFRDTNEKTHIGFADRPKSGGARVGDKSNRLGRFLAGLAGKPPTEDFNVTPSDYFGKRYMLVYGPNKNGNIHLQSFTPLPQ